MSDVTDSEEEERLRIEKEKAAEDAAAITKKQQRENWPRGGGLNERKVESRTSGSATHKAHDEAGKSEV